MKSVQIVKILTISILAILDCCSASCSVSSQSDEEAWRPAASARDAANFKSVCMDALRSHVSKEFSAGLQYLVMAAHFASDTIGLHNLAAMFEEHADEERQHGLKFIEYLRMRGDQQSLELDELSPLLSKFSWEDAEEGLRDALAMEKTVSVAIRELVEVCEQAGDVHAADWMTSNWLDEQLEAQRELSGMINSLNSFRRDHHALADWMFDLKLKK